MKDLTEEDIRRYAAAISCMAEKVDDGGDLGGGSPAPDPGFEGTDAKAAVAERSAVAQRVMGNSVPFAEDEDLQSKLAQALPETEAERQEMYDWDKARYEENIRREMEGRKAVEDHRGPFSEEDRLRLEVLSEMDRSQMPAVHKEGCLLQKTVEHYTFADSEDVATISIDLDKDLFDGAAAHVTEGQIEVVTRDSEVTVLLRSLPCRAEVCAALADWQLYLRPLFHSVEPDGTVTRLRKGKVSVKLRKKKAQPWRKLLKF